MSEFSLALSLRTGLLSASLPAALSERALAHTPSLLLPHSLSLPTLSLSFSHWLHNARPRRVVSWIIYACLCSCRRHRWLSQKHSDRGIVSARGTLENQCSSLPRRVRLCSKPSTDCIPLSLTLRKNVKRTEIQQLEACSKANLWIIAHDFQKLKQNTQNRNTKYTSYFHLKHTKTNTARKL